jgi:hypothetical protein
LATAEALEPLRLAEMPAWPRANANTGTDTVVWPAGTLTCVGALMMPGGATLIGTSVAVVCAEEMVRVKVAVAPSVMEAVTGTSDTTVGGAGATVIDIVGQVPGGSSDLAERDGHSLREAFRSQRTR